MMSFNITSLSGYINQISFNLIKNQFFNSPCRDKVWRWSR
jgi:hypothetical protein